MKRQLKIIFGIGVPLGIVLLMTKNYMGTDDSTFWKQYAILGVVVIAGAVLINCLYQVKFIRQLSNISKRMVDTGDLDEFIEELEYLLVRTKSRVGYRQNLILINLSYGYSKKKEYAKGLAILESIDPNQVRGANQVIYLLNMINFHFYLKNYEDVIEITEQNTDVFSKFSRLKHMEFPLAANTICYHIAKGQMDQAKELLEEAEKKWTDNEMQDEWEYFGELIAEAQSEDE